MTQEQETVLLIKGAISELPVADMEVCAELCDHLRRVVKQAGPIVWNLALALIGSESQEEAGNL